jgi:hypothetical protein
MEQFRYDSYCGLYCGACDIMATYKKSSAEGRTATWDDLPTEFSKNLPWSKKSEIICYGCKSDTVFVGCRRCFIRKCAKNKMRVDVCFDCKKYPCLKIKSMNFLRIFMQKKLPHVNSVFNNQIFIREKGNTAWLAQQKEIWKCPECGTDFSWYTKTCGNCGRELESEKEFRK